MKFEFRFSEFSDVDETYLTPTDVKQYVFCPRVTYFARVARMRAITGSQQQEAKKDHKKLANLEKRRSSFLRQNFPFKIVKRDLEVYLRSEKLKVHGVVDLIITTDQDEVIPVEFKVMVSKKGHAHLDHKYQLVVISLLIEEGYQTIVRRGFIHYLKDKKTVQVLFTEAVKRQAQIYLRRIRNMLSTGLVPPPRRLCKNARAGCGFADQCRDF